MHRTLLAAGTAAAALVLAAVTAAPAEAASYAVSIKTSKTQTDVGTRFTLSGKVTGRGAGGKTVVIERKIGSGKWTKLTTTKTTSKGTYERKLTAKSVGAKQYRVVAGASSSVGRGTSAAVTVTGFTWLTLAEQPTTAQIATVNISRRAGGKTYPHSIVLLGFAGSSAVIWQVDKKCDGFSTSVVVDPAYAADGDAATGDVVSGTDPFSSPDGPRVTAKNGTPTAFKTTTLKGADYFALALDQTEGSEGSTPTVDLLTPKAHCSVTTLPGLRLPESSPMRSGASLLR